MKRKCKVSKFQSFHASKIQSFKGSQFQRYKNASNVCWKILIPYYHISISCFLEDIDPILPNFHFMFSGRSWYHIQAFLKSIRRIFGICRLRLFHNNPSFRFRVWRFPTIICLEMDSGFLSNYLEYHGVSKDKWDWFGESWTHPPSPKNIKMNGLGFVPKRILKAY